jgi:hypothetical protein
MNKKIIFLTCVIGIIALLTLNSISADISDVDTSDWVNITAGNVDFQIPPEYGGGRNSSGDYVKDTVFDFGLVGLETDKSLRNNYGYESTLDELYDVEEMEIDGHHAVAYYSHRSICNHDVTYLYFESNKTFFALSYNGNEVNDTIKKIVSYSPKSAFTKEKFNEKLNTMQEDYIEEQREYEEAYAYEEGYRNGYSQGSMNSRYHHDDYFAYYLFYKLGKRSR